MANIFNDDFRDFLAALNKQEVKYILVGGFSVNEINIDQTLQSFPYVAGP